MDSDKVIVMDGGSLVEFDRPFNLLKNHNGLFYQLVEQTGQTTTGLLHQIAAEVTEHLLYCFKILIS